MLIVDTALAKRAEQNKPLQVGLCGAGAMGELIVSQTTRHTAGMRIAVICNRTLANARAAYTTAGVPSDMIVECETSAQVDDAIAKGLFAITADPAALIRSDGVEVMIDATGNVEHGAAITLAAIDAGMDIVSMNVEMDATIGPILKKKADAAGVILSGCDGDQPGVQMNLFRWVKTMGFTPLVCGNIKGLQDRYRNPETQAAFAKQWGQTPHMVTSFADGTKISMEQAVVANATGMGVAVRGMLGPEHRASIDDLTSFYDIDMLRERGGIVDYALGSLPNPGIYIFAAANDELQEKYLRYGKLGDGPLYSFYTPWHLIGLEVHISAARVALLRDVVMQPLDGPVVEVIAGAKIDLKAGATLDGLGGFCAYGMCENYGVARAGNMIPMGLIEGCVLKRDIPKDQVITWDDVEPNSGTIAYRLRMEQDAAFPG